jgi:hypothetical protein
VAQDEYSGDLQDEEELQDTQEDMQDVSQVEYREGNVKEELQEMECGQHGTAAAGELDAAVESTANEPEELDVIMTAFGCTQDELTEAMDQVLCTTPDREPEGPEVDEKEFWNGVSDAAAADDQLFQELFPDEGSSSSAFNNGSSSSANTGTAPIPSVPEPTAGAVAEECTHALPSVPATKPSAGGKKNYPKGVQKSNVQPPVLEKLECPGGKFSLDYQALRFGVKLGHTKKQLTILVGNFTQLGTSKVFDKNDEKSWRDVSKEMHSWLWTKYIRLNPKAKKVQQPGTISEQHFQELKPFILNLGAKVQ